MLKARIRYCSFSSLILVALLRLASCNSFPSVQILLHSFPFFSVSEFVVESEYQLRIFVNNEWCSEGQDLGVLSLEVRLTNGCFVTLSLDINLHDLIQIVAAYCLLLQVFFF
ncbi:unnamed protein product [Vicia faba]|uniref:Uncharacterized protein n=1 Tax=Vicia faba TaxID=3906 RepID=A0AAV1AKG7_VICFA|nr:unnamed protein product [Vicia faba]